VNENKSRGLIAILRLLVIGTFFLCWEVGARKGVLDSFFFSSPITIAQDLVHLFLSRKIYEHIMMTMKEACCGLFLGTVAGIIAGVLLGKYEILARVMDPVLMGLYAIPKIAIAPLFILWFGLGITSKIVFTWVVVFFLIFFNTYAGMKNIDTELIDTVKTMGASNWQILTKVSLPSCMPWIFVGLRSSLGAAMIAAIVGEFVAADTGLGHLIIEGSTMFMTQRVLAIVLLLSVIVIILDICLRTVEKRCLRWKPEQKK
jgi:NitT/TauT family transport system permease protein